MTRWKKLTPAVLGKTRLRNMIRTVATGNSRNGWCATPNLLCKSRMVRQSWKRRPSNHVADLFAKYGSTSGLTVMLRTSPEGYTSPTHRTKVHQGNRHHGMWFDSGSSTRGIGRTGLPDTHQTAEGSGTRPVPWLVLTQPDHQVWFARQGPHKELFPKASPSTRRGRRCQQKSMKFIGPNKVDGRWGPSIASGS